MNEIQQIIQELQVKGWTVAAIARAGGVDYSTVTRWRSGVTVPDNDVAVTLLLRHLLAQPVPERRYRRRASR
jgi:transcriptional regulator with XRE-family HTH domain